MPADLAFEKVARTLRKAFCKQKTVKNKRFFQRNFFVSQYFLVIPKVSETLRQVLHDSFGITGKYL